MNNIGVGELALACPTCPRPGINLPTNWRDAPLEDEYIFAFRLFCIQLRLSADSYTKKSRRQTQTSGCKISFALMKSPTQGFIPVERTSSSGKVTGLMS